MQASTRRDAVGVRVAAVPGADGTALEEDREAIAPSRESWGCKAKTTAAVRISHGTQAVNHCGGSTSISTAPSIAPTMLGTRSHTAHGGCPTRSPRYAHDPATAPGQSPIVLVALAITSRDGSAGRIAASTGNVRMVPPPATAFTAPATNDTAASATSPGSGPRARRSFMESRLILFVNAAFTWDEASPD